MGWSTKSNNIQRDRLEEDLIVSWGLFDWVITKGNKWRETPSKWQGCGHVGCINERTIYCPWNANAYLHTACVLYSWSWVDIMFVGAFAAQYRLISALLFAWNQRLMYPSTLFLKSVIDKPKFQFAFVKGSVTRLYSQLLHACACKCSN